MRERNAALRVLCTLFMSLCFAAHGARAQDADPPPPPNVLLIMTDDQGWGDMRSHGNPALDTPAMDRLAREGVRFERFYVDPVCSPTRAALLTGRYSLRTGVHGVTRGHETMRSEEVTLAEVFRNAGYATGAFGKWHNGAHYPHDPNGQGFDTFFGFTAGHWNNYFDTRLERNGEPVRTEGFITDVLTDAALRFIETNKDRPFFCYVPYNAPHSPVQAPDRYFRKYRERGFDNRDAGIYAMVENVDDNLGRLLDRLDELGLSERTIVLFLTDNGPNGDRYNGDMRGWKGSVHEGGVRVPFFVRWPGELEAGRVVRRIAAHIDVLPTLVDLTGIPAPQPRALDGRSLVPLLRGTAEAWPDRKLFTHRFRMGAVEPSPGAVRKDRWRAVDAGDGWELYDMIQDPAQRVDVAAEYPDVLADMREAYAAWYTDVTKAGFDPIPAPIGHPERDLVTLPGHEALLHGEGISYVGSSGWANDWVTNWTDADAYPSWPVDVLRPGRYDVAILYTASEEQVGTDVRVELGEAYVDGRLREVHDPPPLFSPDLELRGEVYEKEWASLPLGTVRLEAGPVDLNVRVTALPPGGRAMDVKAVQIRRIGG